MIGRPPGMPACTTGTGKASSSSASGLAARDLSTTFVPSFTEMGAPDIRHWKRRYVAVAEAELAALRKRGARPAWSVAVSLEMFEASRIDPRSDEQRTLRELDAAPIRARWRVLRDRLIR